MRCGIGKERRLPGGRPSCGSMLVPRVCDHCSASHPDTFHKQALSLLSAHEKEMKVAGAHQCTSRKSSELHPMCDSAPNVITTVFLPGLVSPDPT